MKINKKLFSYLLLWVFSINTIISPLVTFADSWTLSDLDQLLNPTLPFSELRSNPNIWIKYVAEIQRRSMPLFKKLSNLTNKIISTRTKEYDNDNMWSLLGSILWNNSKETNNEKINNLENKIKVYQKSIDSLRKIQNMLSRIVEKRNYKKGSLVYAVLWYVYYKIDIKTNDINNTISNYKTRINKLQNNLDLNQILWDITVNTGSNNIQTGSNKKTISVSFIPNYKTKIKSNEIELWKFNVKWGYVEYFWRDTKTNNPINILECRINNDFNWNIPFKIKWWYLKWINYSWWPKLFTKININNISGNVYDFSIDRYSFSITNGMKLMLSLNNIPSNNWVIKCKINLNKILTNNFNVKNINLDKGFSINYEWWNIQNNNINKNICKFKNSKWWIKTLTKWNHKVLYPPYHSYFNMYCNGNWEEPKYTSNLFAGCEKWYHRISTNTYNCIKTIKSPIYNTTTWTVAYCIWVSYPSSWLGYQWNKVSINKYIKKWTKWTGKQVEILWTFTNKPNLYKVSLEKWHNVCKRIKHKSLFHYYYTTECHYVWVDKPKNWYNKYNIYKWTKYDWLTQDCMLASNSLIELANKIKKWVTWKLATNNHWWNLNRKDNYWTIFKFYPNLWNIIGK